MASVPIIDESTGHVVNVVVAAPGWQPPDGYVVGVSGGRIGDRWDGTKYVDDTQDSAPTPHDVNVERDKRINSGFSVDFGGGVIKQFDSTQDARDNIAGVHSFALAAIVGGAQQGNLRWANPDSDFEWICADNSKITMDAFTAREFAEAAMEYKSAIIFAARVVKDMATIPGNYADDQYWPSSTLTLG